MSAKEKFSFKQFIVPNFWKKFVFMAVSILLMGFFLSFLIEVGWGTDPASFMNLNISAALGWTFGNWQLLLNALMLLIVFFFEPCLIGFGTVFNMVMIGYTADFCRWIWKLNGVAAFIAESDFFVRVAIFSLSIICFVFAAAVYMNSRMGLSPYDGSAKIFSEKLSFLPFFAARIIFDISVVLVGFIASRFAAGGTKSSAVGATIVGLLLGPAISWVGSKIKPLLD